MPCNQDFSQEIDSAREYEKIIIRFNELALHGKTHLCHLLHRYSRLTTVQRMDESDIFRALELTNPIIAESRWRDEIFSGGALNAYTETRLSRIALLMNRRRNLNSDEIQRIRDYALIRNYNNNDNENNSYQEYEEDLDDDDDDDDENAVDASTLLNHES